MVFALVLAGVLRLLEYGCYVPRVTVAAGLRAAGLDFS